MNFAKREAPIPPAGEIEQITAEFPIYLDPGDEVVVDDVPGRPEGALVDVKRRIRDTVESAGGGEDRPRPLT